MLNLLRLATPRVPNRENYLEIDMVPDEDSSSARGGLELLEFEWQFRPPDLFEERTELTWSERKFGVDAGKVTAQFETSGGPDAWPMLASELHQVVLTQFLAAQVLSHQRFTLSRLPPRTGPERGVRWARH
jgi:hypothetical protein